MTVITANYYIDKAEIIEKFCINKDKPSMGCNGKCHLKKQLNIAEHTNENSEPDLSVLPELLVYLPLTLHLNFHTTFSYSKKEYFNSFFCSIVMNPPWKPPTSIIKEG